MNIFVFDIETIPDVATGRLIYQLTQDSDEEVADLMQKKREEKTGSGFLPHYLHRIVSISGVLRTNDFLRVGSFGDTNSNEASLVEAFFKYIEKHLPILISWNGSGFDLPVLHYRALLHGVSSPSYWNIGDAGDMSFRWNNYLSRYHYRHTDLMDILAGYQGRANAPLTEIALMLGLPGKLGMNGSQIWNAFLNNKIEAIRNYCEIDVLNTYLIYLRFELIRGKLTQTDFQQECGLLRSYLNEQKKIHFNEFLSLWKS